MDNFSPKLHLVLCLHGLDGFDSDLEFLKMQLQKRYKNLLLFAPSANHRQTYDGIRRGAERIIAELNALVEEKSIKTAYLSVIGHSLGGLYARCLLGLLHQNGQIPMVFDPICYISLVTPHVGSREHGKILGYSLTGMLLSTVVGSTGAELMLYDNYGGKIPFLVELSTPKWTDVLTLFKRLVCYSNTRYDISVHYSTAAIRAPGSTYIPRQKVLLYPAILDDPVQEPYPPAGDLSYESIILTNLLKLDWKRYAVIPSRPFLAHIDIIIKSVWLNHRHGIAIVSHIIDHFRSLPPPSEPVHLFVLLHDINLSSRDLLNLQEEVRNKFPRPTYKVISPTVDFEEKLVDWLIYQLNHSRAKKLSFIGHGTGGLLARWLSGMLRRAGEIVEFVNLVCVDTPHLSMGLPQTTLWCNSYITDTADETRMADLINLPEFVDYVRDFKNLILYASTKDPSLSLKAGLLLDNKDSISGLDNEQPASIILINNLCSGAGISSLCWKRFAMIPSKISKLLLFWNEVDHPFLGHITKELLA